MEEFSKERIIQILSGFKVSIGLSETQINEISDVLTYQVQKPNKYFVCKAMMHGSEIFKEYCKIQCDHCLSESNSTNIQTRIYDVKKETNS